MNREYTNSHNLQDYVSKMTLDKNRGVYLSDTPNASNQSSSFITLPIIGIIVVTIIFVLAYFNINLIIISGNIIQKISDTITPIFLGILHYFGVGLGTTVVATTTVASTAISDVATSVDSANQAISGTIVSGIQGNGINESAYPIKSIQNTNDPSFHIVNTSPQMAQQQQDEEDKQYMNSVQYNTPVGYCFIGDQYNKRTCAEVSNAHLCASGDIFPTMDMCINPNLRVS
jgi:hypothetical protein